MKRSTRSRWGTRLAVALAALALVQPAAATVHITGDGSGNTTPPADDPGFDNVGVTDTNLSGVYLGKSWVITAHHVGVRPITFLGTQYQPVPGTETRLQNVDSTFIDVLVYRIDGFPALPDLVLSSAPPTLGEPITCIGNGWDREATTTSWNSQWQEQAPPVFTGYKRLGSARNKRWGRNLISVPSIIVFDTQGFEALFDTPGIADEGAAVPGDSGGACFAKRSGTWELAGLVFARRVFQDGSPPEQPADTAVFGNSTVAADVDFYRATIEAATPAPPIVPLLPGPWAWALVAALLGSGGILRARWR